MSDGREPTPWWVRPVEVAAFSLAWVALAASILLVFIDNDEPTRIGLFGTFLGIAFTLAGLALAARIYQRQHDHARGSQKATNKRLDDLEELITSASKVPLDAEEADAAADDVEESATAFDAEDEEAGDETWYGETPGRRFQRDDVPLSVIANLVWGWRLNHPTQSKDGHWVVGNLLGAWRPSAKTESGGGNTPWYVTFEDTRGDKRVWRLYRGGKRKRVPTIRDVTDEISAT